VRDWLWLLLLGMLGMVLHPLLFLGGLSLTTATNAGMVSPAISVFSTAISVALCLEKLSMWKVAGISITVLGALIILEVHSPNYLFSNFLICHYYSDYLNLHFFKRIL
jgi:drug/metabolite transporter (DMT)-like permease